MRIASLFLIGIQLACASVATVGDIEPSRLVEQDKVGVLIMAHGADDEWNQSVVQAVDPISENLPVAIAFGMANPMTLQAGLDSLDSEGVTHVAVVRMYLSGQSFLDGLDFSPGIGLLPHSELSNWVRSMTQKVIESEGWNVDAVKLLGSGF